MERNQPEDDQLSTSDLTVGIRQRQNSNHTTIQYDHVKSPEENSEENSEHTSVQTNEDENKANKDKKIQAVPLYKSIPAGIIAFLLIWKPLFVVLFPGWVYTSDLSTVFLFEGCIGGSTQTVFVFCLLEILIACVFLQRIVVPAIFGLQAWEKFDHLKRRKLTGFCVKILVRASCFIQIAALVAPHLNCETGLFGNFNIKESNRQLQQNHTVITCEEAGMNLTDAVAMRAWIFSRDDIMAVMVWELACIPELGIDAWAHHLFVILGVVIGTDPYLLSGQAQIQPFIDNVAFFLIWGGAVAGLVESCVLMYHLNAGNPTKQARYMQLSIALQSIMVLTLFVTFPIIVVVKNFDHFGGIAWVYLVLIALLVAVEARMVWIKISIVKHAKKKAADLLCIDNTSINSTSSRVDLMPASDSSSQEENSPQKEHSKIKASYTDPPK